MALSRTLKRFNNLLPLSKSISRPISLTYLSSSPSSNSHPNPNAIAICKLLSGKHDPSSVDISLRDLPVPIQEVSSELVLDVLTRLSNAGILALSFFRWAEKQNGFNHTTESFHALIESLGRIRQFKMVWNLVDDMKKRKLVTVDTFAIIARRYIRARMVKEAFKVFEKMQLYGLNSLKPQVSDFNKFIDVFCKSKSGIENAQELFDKMREWNLEPNVKSYTILLEGWSHQGNLLRVNEVYREMKGEGFEPDVVTYGIIVNAYCKARKYDEAIGFYHEMLLKNMRPSPHIYCTLINGLGSGNRLGEALEFFEKSKASGFAPEAPTYNAVVGAYCWSLKMDDAYRVIDEMKKLGIGPNSRTYDIVLHHLIKAQRTEEAYLVFKRMSSSGDMRCEPSANTYDIMVGMFCNDDKLDMAMAVWDEMKAKGILPGMHVFSTLIFALCNENKLDEACKYFQQMLDVGIRPPANMLSTFKQALIDAGMENTAIHFARKIDKLRNTPLIA